MGMSRTPAGRSKPGWRCVQSSFPRGNQRIRSPADCHPLVSGLSSARQRTVLRSSADCHPLASGLSSARQRTALRSSADRCISASVSQCCVSVSESVMSGYQTSDRRDVSLCVSETPVGVRGNCAGVSCQERMSECVRCVTLSECFRWYALC